MKSCYGPGVEMLASDDADLFARPADLKNGPVTIKMDSDPVPISPSGRRLCFAWWPSERFLVAFLFVLLIGGSQAASVSRRTLASNTNSPGPVVQQQHHQHRHHHHAKPAKNADGQCAWMQWESDASLTDVAGTRAYLAPVVFEGKARSRSDGPVYRVTFDVVTVFKGDVSPGSQVRLEFAKAADSGALRSLGGSRRQPAGTAVVAERVKPSRTSGRSLSSARDSHSSSSSSSSSPSGRAVQRRRPEATNQLSNHHSSNSHHRHHSHQNKCLVTAEIRTGRHYLVFANRWGPNNFTAFGSPIVPTKKSLKDVRSTLCPRCGESMRINHRLLFFSCFFIYFYRSVE